VATRFVFLVNTIAGAGQAPKRLNTLLARHPDVAARARVVATTSPLELAESLRLRDDEIPIAVGGDGSLNTLVTLLDERGELSRTVGVVPFGTGNAVAHTLGLRSAGIAMQALATLANMPLDILRTNAPHTPIALVSCSTGFESNFLARYAAVRYRSRQWAGWSALLLNVPKRMRGVSLVLDGVPWVTPDEVVHNIGVYNIPHYAFGKVMWRGMDANDGRAIAAVVTTPLSYWGLMARGTDAPVASVATSAPLGGVRTARWQTAELSSPVALQIDGEATQLRSVMLRVDPRAVTAICAVAS
jgi:diacylglycerol kinase (ATP)